MRDVNSKKRTEVSPIHKEVMALPKKEQAALMNQNPSYANIRYVLHLINTLFTHEREYVAKKYTIDEIKQARQTTDQAILEELFLRLQQHETEYTTKSKMGVAITYALNQWKYLINYLKDGRVELSNNRAERAIKPFVMGRKNWLFSNTKQGAHVSSMYYSIIESAKMNHLDIEGYLCYLITELKDMDPEAREGDLRKLLPYSEELRYDLKIKTHSNQK